MRELLENGIRDKNYTSPNILHLWTRKKLLNQQMIDIMTISEIGTIGMMVVHQSFRFKYMKSDGTVEKYSIAKGSHGLVKEQPCMSNLIHFLFNNFSKNQKTLVWEDIILKLVIVK